MGRPFSLRCLSPLCSPAVSAGQTQIAVLGMLRCSLDIFETQKASVGSNPRWLFYASRRACCRMAVFSIQLAGNHTEPASREACCRAAVTPQPSRISLECPAPYGRGVGCRGSPPAASHEACRRMAVFSIQQTRKPHQSGEPRGPSPSGGKTPAKPHIPLRPCAPKARRPARGSVHPVDATAVGG